MSTFDRLCFLVVSVVLAMPPALAADPPVIGMVLDLQGTAQVTESGRTSKLQLLARLTPESRIELAEGARTSVTLYATRSVYRLTGPAVVDVGKEGLTIVKGTAPEVRAMGQKAVSAPPGASFATGAYRMRSTRLLPPVLLVSPENGSVLLDTRPSFSWDTADDAGSVRVELQTEAGQPAYSATVKGNRWALPEGAQLARGMEYKWTVTLVSQPEGEAQKVEGKFSVAAKVEADEFAALKPAETDPIEDWVYYAVLLQQRQMRGDARSVWQRIARERPDLTRAAELARSP